MRCRRAVALPLLVAALVGAAAPAGAWSGRGSAAGLPSAGLGVAGAAGAGPRWAWPLAPRPSIVRAFDPPESDYGAGHRGIDLTGTVGGAVTAVEGGVVFHAGVVAGRGTVTIRHLDGLRSTYEPLELVVRTGAVVTTGTVLGTLAAGSHCPGACLHLGAVVAGGYRDPRPLLLGPRPVVLLPLTGSDR